MSDKKGEMLEEAEKTIWDSFLYGLKKCVSGIVIGALTWFLFMTICVMHLPTIYSGLVDMGILNKIDHPIGKHIMVQFSDGTKNFIPRTNDSISFLNKEITSMKAEVSSLKKDIFFLKKRKFPLRVYSKQALKK